MAEEVSWGYIVVPTLLVLILVAIILTMPKTNVDAYKKSFEDREKARAFTDSPIGSYEQVNSDGIVALSKNVGLDSKGYFYTNGTRIEVPRDENTLLLSPATGDHFIALPTENGVHIVPKGDTVPTHTLQDSFGFPIFSTFDHLSLYVSYLNTEKSGTVIRYDYIQGQWKELQRMVRPSVSSFDTFGRNITVTDRVMLLTDSVSVHVYYRASRADEWDRVKSIYPPLGSPLLFGSQTILTEKACYVSSPYEHADGTIYSGRVHMYERTRGTWTVPVPITSPQIQEEGRFGSRMIQDDVDKSIVWILDSYGAYAFRGSNLIQTVEMKTGETTNPLAFSLNEGVLTFAGSSSAVHGYRDDAHSLLRSGRKREENARS